MLSRKRILRDVTKCGAWSGVDNFINAVNDSEGSREQAFEKAKTAVAQTAKAMAALHSSKVSNTASQAVVKELVNDLRQQFFYLKKNRELDHLRGIDFDKLSQFMEAVSSNFTAQPGKGVVVHGDPHPGNFFYDEKDNVLTMIDISTMSRSFGDDGSGLFPAAWDASLFEHKIADTGLVGTNLTPEEARILEQTFAKSYQEADTATLVTPAAMAFCQLNRLLSTLVNRIQELQRIKLDNTRDNKESMNTFIAVIKYTNNKLSTLMMVHNPATQQPNIPILKSSISARSIDERIPLNTPNPKGRTPNRPSRFNPNP